MAAEGAAGFWSYTHEDDRLDGGRILRLAEKLKDEYALLTGEELQLFLDRDDLRWGDEWRTRIDHALAGTTFFIPILSPRYFASPECRKELLTFAGHAKSLGVQELLLPILYVDVPELHDGDEASDEAVQLVASMQRQDWTDLRLVDENSEEYRTAANGLARRLIEISKDVAQREQILAPAATLDREAEQQAAPGLIDLLATGEEALPLLGETLEKLGREIEQVGRIADEATPELAASDARGAGFAGRLAVVRRLANRLDEPAEGILRLGGNYGSHLVDVDPAMLTIIRLGDEVDPASEEAQQAEEFFASVRELGRNAEVALTELRTLVNSLEEAATWSRDLARPVQKMKQGLQSVLDGQAVIEEWARRVAEIEARRGGSRASRRGDDILEIEPVNGLGPTAGTDALQRVRGPYPDENAHGP